MDIKDLPGAIEKEVAAYSSQVTRRIVTSLNETADAIIEFIKENAPRGTSNNHLADSFVKVSYGEGVNQIIVIYSKTKSGLVHLLEFGFKHRSGRLVAARPFLRPSYENMTPPMLAEIRRIIEEGS